MPRVRTRCFRAVVLAAALVSAVAAAPAAAPAVPAGGSSVATPAGTATAGRDVRYDVEVRNGRGTSRATGDLTWTPKGVANDGRLVNHGGGRAVVIFHLSVLRAKDVVRTFGARRDGSSPTDFTVVRGHIVAIEVQVCNRRPSDGADRPHRCSEKHFSGWGTRRVSARS